MAKTKITISPDYTGDKKLEDFINTLPERFPKEGNTLYDERNVIKSFPFNSPDEILKEVVVKRFKFPNPVQRIVYSFFRTSKAKRAFRNAAELRNRGINTPREIACIEEWKNGLFGYGYYISGSDYAPPIRERLVVPDQFDRTMAADFATFAVGLHQKGILHHDLNSTNVLYHPHDGRYTFSVIDINRVDFFRQGIQPSKHQCFDNLTRFTGRMDLFEYVLRCYAEVREWDVQFTVQEAVNIKNKHDKQWRRRKAFLRKLKFRKKK